VERRRRLVRGFTKLERRRHCLRAEIRREDRDESLTDDVEKKQPKNFRGHPQNGKKGRSGGRTGKPHETPSLAPHPDPRVEKKGMRE